MLQAQIADACGLGKVMVLISGHIEEPETVVSSPFWPYQVDRFVRVVKTAAKDKAPFFLIAKRDRRNTASSLIP